MLAMAARFKLLKCLFFLFLLVGDIGPQPASLEAHLPRAPPREDQANLLFAPAHLCLLEFRHSFSSLVAVIALLFTFGVGFFLLSLMSAVLHLCEWLLPRRQRYWYIKLIIAIMTSGFYLPPSTCLSVDLVDRTFSYR